MSNKKSQIHMGETIAVLLIFFILVFLGLIFYTRIIRGNIENELTEARQLEAIKIAQRVSYLPELQCSDVNVIKDDCIDALKLDASIGIIKSNNDFYPDQFKFSKITVKGIYPDETESLTIYDKSLTDFTDKIHTNFPVDLYDPISEKHSFGVIEVDTYFR